MIRFPSLQRSGTATVVTCNLTVPTQLVQFRKHIYPICFLILPCLFFTHTPSIHSSSSFFPFFFTSGPDLPIDLRPGTAENAFHSLLSYFLAPCTLLPTPNFCHPSRLRIPTPTALKPKSSINIHTSFPSTGKLHPQSSARTGELRPSSNECVYPETTNNFSLSPRKQQPTYPPPKSRKFRSFCGK
jgi:hypothetical protein